LDHGEEVFVIFVSFCKKSERIDSLVFLRSLRYLL